ncbi:metalloprotease [Conoideocrella luteorostrata]|uniref:Metalloprotease n=1 Tax=Conoideocrella luteorostrata TaxID=1105319 RepID=A0AAJ0CMB1_9HYPO|nr:metalloprotease [Conoideocrella luteorostrata]
MPSEMSTGRKTGRHGSVVLLTDRLEKPDLDNRQYRVVRLENDLEALLVCDPETDKASAAMDVNVGNFSDEEGMPGLAHGVEHLLFMGTKKFPGENEYNVYLSANSGESNAYTASTSTNYYFEVAARPKPKKNDDARKDEESRVREELKDEEVSEDDEESGSDDDDEPQEEEDDEPLEGAKTDESEVPSESNPSPFHGALDRFAQFFIEPLFLSKTLDNEMIAVDNENKKNLQSDLWRLHQLEKSLSNPKHPYCHFSTGNYEVLKTIPESQGINVREKFMEFHARHYSANRMKLVVLGREPLDVLQEWVEELFSDIENKNLPPNRWTEEEPFRESDLGTQCFAKPVMDSRELNLMFPIIDEEHLFESQPSRYVSHLIGHESPGSIMSYIKMKGWGNGLSAGAHSICPGTPSTFYIQVKLTEEGLKYYSEIVKIIFQYIAMLRESPPQEWIFDEQKRLADADFKFRQNTPHSTFTSRTSSVMQKPLPREWLLSGHSRLRTFDALAISKVLDRIRPKNMRMTIVSRNFPGNWDKKETWYGTEYRYEKIPAGLLDELEAAMQMPKDKRLPELHLPHVNNCIANKLEVDKKEVSQPALAPRVLRNDQVARTWWKKDDTFWAPKANVVISLKNPVNYASAANSVKAKLFAELVRDALEEDSYNWDLAGVHYTISFDRRGLVLNFSGYNDKLPVLLEQVAVTTRDLSIKDERFDIVKERLTRGYENRQLQSAFHQVGDYLYWLNSERSYIVEEYAAELPNITADAVRLFHKQVLSQCYIEVYIHGNMYRNDALKVTDIVESTFQPRRLPQPEWPIGRSMVLPPGSNFVYKKELKDPANVNHCVQSYFHIGDRGDRQIRAKTLLLAQMIHEPAFDQLRTKEQLGYIVFSGARSFATTIGLSIIVQSEKTPEYLDRRIEAFLTRFGRNLRKMTKKAFNDHKQSLTNALLEKLRNLNQESSRHWTQISNEYYDFEQGQQDAAYVKTLARSEMRQFFNTYLSPSSTTRGRISVHLRARGAGEVDTKMANGLTNGISAVDSAQEITDVRQFKAGLLPSPGPRPAKEISEFEESDAKL